MGESHSVNASAKRWIYPVTATGGWRQDFKCVLVADSLKDSAGFLLDGTV